MQTQESSPGGLGVRVGRAIARLRREGPLGRMTQKDFAKRISISPSYLEKLERGVGRLTVSHVERMARALGVRAEDLVREGEDGVPAAVIAPFLGVLRLHPVEPEVAVQCAHVLETMLKELSAVGRSRVRPRVSAR